MQTKTELDCIVVGYNDIDFDVFANQQKAMEDRSGAYHEIKANSVNLYGKRVPYMELLNSAIERATGQNPGFNVFEIPSPAVCYLKNYLNQNNFNVEIINFFNNKKDKFKELLTSCSPRAVAITTTFYVENSPIIEIVKFIRKYNLETKIIVGGPHILNIASDLDRKTQEYVFKILGADIFIIELQGEQTLVQVLHQLKDCHCQDLTQIPNLFYRAGNGAFHRTERIAENNNLDQNSIQWRDFVPSFVTPITHIRTSRGCPFACAFCNYHTMTKEYALSTVETIENELSHLHEMGTTVVNFVDDTFNTPLTRFKKLLKMMIKNRFNFKWTSFLRVANIDEEAMDLMKESGCIGVFLGIESGDQQILTYMNKNASVDNYLWGIDQLKKRDIMIYVSLICGFPGETDKSVINTIGFMEKAAPTFFNVQLYYHDIRAPIQKQAEKFGIVSGGYNWKHNSMDWKEAAYWVEYMFRHITHSIPMSLYGFSIWGITYLISKGITMEKIIAFGKIAREMFLPSFSDIPMDFTDQENRLTDLFRERREQSHDVAFAKTAEKSHQPALSSSQNLDNQYWTYKLAGVPKVLELPYDFILEKEQDSFVNTEKMALRSAIHLGLKEIATRHNTTIANVVLSIFHLFLFRLSKQDDFCVGLYLPASPQLVPIRTRLKEDMDFEQLLEQIIRNTSEASMHRHLPVDHQMTLNVIYGFEQERDVRFYKSMAFYLALFAYEQKESLYLSLQYNRNLYLVNTIRKYLSILERFSKMVLSA